MTLRYLRALCSALLFAATASAQQPASLTIDTHTPVAHASPTLYGLMTEEINYSYDGGLYPEMVSNRAFKNNRGPQPRPLDRSSSRAPPAPPSLRQDHRPQRRPPPQPQTHRPTPPLRSLRRHRQRRLLGHAPSVPHDHLPGSLYAKSGHPHRPITIRLIDDNTAAVLASTSIPALTTTGSNTPSPSKPPPPSNPPLTEPPRNHPSSTPALSGSASSPSSRPPITDRPNGLRIDLMEKLAAMHPAFLRFPGGNYLEGDRIDERFDWKKTIGPLDRPSHSPQPLEYHSSDGLGLLEFLELVRRPEHAARPRRLRRLLSPRRPHQPRPDSNPTFRMLSTKSNTSPATPPPSGEPSAQRTATPSPSTSPTSRSATKTNSTNPTATTAASPSSTKPSSSAIPHSRSSPPLRSKARTPDVVDDHYYRSAARVLQRRPSLRQDRPQRPEDLRRRVGHTRRRAHHRTSARPSAMPPG